MAEKRRFLDVWLVEPNTVYREVPYAVVTDWVQQSRVQPDDMLRPSGTAQWFRVGDSPEFKPFIPVQEAVFVEDEASAREDVALDFRWKKRGGDEDDDVDMIPLIDVSLVLLVFFMLTSTVADAGSMVQDIPRTETGLVIGKEGMIYINVKHTTKADLEAEFSVSVGPGPALKYRVDSKDPYPKTLGEVMEQVKDNLEVNRGKLIDVTIRASEKVQSGLVRKITLALHENFGRNKIRQIYYGVGEVQR